MSHSSSPASPPSASPRLFTFSSAGWVILLSAFFSLVAAAIVLYPVFTTGFHQSVGDGHNVDTYGFDLSNLTIPRSALVASGWPKDMVHAIPESLVETDTPAEIEMIHRNEHLNFIVPDDRVIGLTINGETRAYPVHVLNVHEIINDTLGGVPIAVTWAPLCDSAVVFDRRVDGAGAPAVEFGVSGLLVDSDLVAFDRRGHAADESLWPQLALQAVSGPLAGKPMKLIAYEMKTWKEWTSEHPETRVVIGLRTHKTEYTYEPYAGYLANDELKFPVTREWPDPHVARKTRIVVRGAPGGRWVAARDVPGATTASAATEPGEITLHSFLFAWYAMHPADTDYSALQ
ncbi:MAG TPA: DUF3179 domain-containing (seleno)protein [Phycisphaerae bacterium]|nr:DUF3179 domain-containing (seleno)protein [Phycisphaerae bacterium]